MEYILWILGSNYLGWFGYNKSLVSLYILLYWIAFTNAIFVDAERDGANWLKEWKDEQSRYKLVVNRLKTKNLVNGIKIMNKNLVIKVLIIAVPTYTMAIITNAMVYTIPMLAISTLIATNIFKDDEDVENRVEQDSVNTDVSTDTGYDFDGDG